MAVGTAALVSGGLGLASSLMSKKRGMETAGRMKTDQLNIAGFQQPYVQEALRGAQEAYRTPAEQQMGYETASGQMLGQNPYLEDLATQAGEGLTRQFSEQVLPGLQSSFASAGRFGSGLQMEKQRQAARDLGEQLSQQRTQLYGQQYGRERALQEAAQARIDPLERARQYMDITGKQLGGSRDVTKQLPVEKQGDLGKYLGIGGSLLGDYSKDKEDNFLGKVSGYFS